LAWLAALSVALFGLAGCGHVMQSRAVSDEDNEHVRYPIKTVGEYCTVGNAEPIPLGGVGLVEGLDGTGGPAPQDSYRAMLEDQLRKANVKNVKELMNSPNHALVVVEALLPPGAKHGDPIDVEVKLPPGSKATSLRGGYLRKCLLYNYDTARHLSPEYTGPNRQMIGHALAHAEGAVLVGVGTADGDDSGRVKQGRIWAGGRCRKDNPFALLMNQDQQFARITALIADRVNGTFQAGLRGVNDSKVADPFKHLAVALHVPAQYRLNQPRFLRVVRLIPTNGGSDTPLGEGPNHQTYAQRLAADLLDPSRTVVAALRLEALGNHSIPALKKGLDSPHPLVRFTSAEALAYLGSPACGEELARAVAEQPMLRAFGLTAMASLDEAVCHLKLKELLATSDNDETRYGAFRALRALHENDPMVRGEQLNDSFWLHRVAPDTPSLVHVSSTRRAEVVLFGAPAQLKPPFSFLAGEYAVTATEDDVCCSVARFQAGGAPLRKQCSLDLEEVIRALADLGGAYPEVIAVIQQASTTGTLTSRVRCDALPQAVTAHELARAGHAKGCLVPAGQDLGLTPTLYEIGVPSQSALQRERDAAPQKVTR
jgi:hypothetical protein